MTQTSLFSTFSTTLNHWGGRAVMVGRFHHLSAKNQNFLMSFIDIFKLIPACHLYTSLWSHTWNKRQTLSRQPIPPNLSKREREGDVEGEMERQNQLLLHLKDNSMCQKNLPAVVWLILLVMLQPVEGDAWWEQSRRQVNFLRLRKLVQCVL